MATLELVGVSLERPQTLILDRVDLSVEEGEFMVVVGPSGSGKTSLLRVVAGLEVPTAGDVRIGGASATHLSPRQRNLAMVFQNYALYPHMSVRDNLAFGLKVRKTPRDRIDSEVARVAQLLGIESHLHKKPAALSGGERQRVALGRALVRRPALFLYDEPLSNLDARLREVMRTEIARLHELEPTTSLYVTHDQAEAMTLGERMAIFSEGRLRQVGSPERLYRRPGDTFVAGFLGSPRINLLEGELAEGAFRSGSITIAVDGTLGRGRAERVTLGVRPESLTVGPETAGAGCAARVVQVEHFGREVLLHLDAGGVALRALAPPIGSAAAGSTVRVAFHREELHFFDSQSGRRIDPGPGEPE